MGLNNQLFPVMAASAMRIGGIVLAVYVGLFLVVLFRQDRYVYYPDRVVGLTPAYFDIPYEDITLRTEDGETLGAWFVQAAGTERAVILYCHGNAGNIGDRIDAIREFHEMGLSVLIFDYRGYGTSSGKPGEQGTYMDAMAAWKHISESRKGSDRTKIIIYGRSLGGAVATWLAGHTPFPPAALVVESTFTSAPDMAKKMFPFLPSGLVCRFSYDTVSGLREVRCPVLVAHSREDEMIPFAMGKRLFEVAPDPNRLVEMRGGHNTGGMVADPESRRILEEFLVGTAQIGPFPG